MNDWKSLTSCAIKILPPLAIIFTLNMVLQCVWLKFEFCFSFLYYKSPQFTMGLCPNKHITSWKYVKLKMLSSQSNLPHTWLSRTVHWRASVYVSWWWGWLGAGVAATAQHTQRESDHMLLAWDKIQIKKSKCHLLWVCLTFAPPRSWKFLSQTMVNWNPSVYHKAVFPTSILEVFT
jgi:hypothetical protein